MYSLNNPSLIKATELTSKYWFPIQENTIRRLDNYIEVNFKDFSVDDIWKIVENDPSLHLLFLKELAALNLLQFEEGSCGIHNDIPFSTIVDIYKRLKIFKTRHAVSDGSDVQAKRLNEMLIAATTVSKLGEAEAIDVTYLRSAALLRQLGRTLIAWNYPRIFSRVTSTPKTEEEIEGGLRSLLGFSSSMLGYSVADKLGLAPIFSEVFPKQRRSSRVDNESVDSGFFNEVSRLCEIGEALSRASNPETYSSAAVDYQMSSEKISETIGEQGLREFITSLSAGRGELASGVIAKAISSYEGNEEIACVLSKEELLQKNPYIKALPVDLYKVVADLYSRMVWDPDPQRAVELFVKEVLPRTYFASTKIFLVDSIDRKLYTSLSLGEHRTKEVRAKTMELSLIGNLFGSALTLRTPVREVLQDHARRDVNVMAVSIGSPAVGILVVELKDNVGTHSDEELMYFKAMRNLLADCLGLE